MAKTKETPEQKAERLRVSGERLAAAAKERKLKKQLATAGSEVLQYEKDREEYMESLKNGGVVDTSKSHFMPDSENIAAQVKAIGKTVIPELDIPQAIKKEPIKQNHMSTDTLVAPVKSNKPKAPVVYGVKGRISIKPYISGEENMGLEVHGEILFPGVKHQDRLGAEVKNGYVTYFTGLNEMDASVQQLPEDKKVAKITVIRQTVAYLENSIANNFKVRPETCMDNYGKGEHDDFWANVSTFISAGPVQYDQKGNVKTTYWDDVKLELDNKEQELDKSNAHDLVKFYAIQAGGLSGVAPSLSKAIEAQGRYKWYLDQPEETADIQAEGIKLKYQAGAALEQMRLSDENRLFLMAKTLAVKHSSNYRRGGPTYTPVLGLYKDISDYIEGKKGDGPVIAVERFMQFYNMPIDELNRRAVIKDAIEHHLIEMKGDGKMYYRNEMLGKNIEEMVEKLMNQSMYGDTWDHLNAAIETRWAE
jgi:hypothetical protein